MKNKKRIVLAYSGGLDTSIILKWLQENYKAEIIAYTADVGQKMNKKQIIKNAKSLGVKNIVINDLKKINKNLEYLSVGGQNLKSLGIKSIYDLKEITYLGFTNVITNIFKINKKIIFKHNKDYLLPDGKRLIACYHPSPRNVNTKVVSSSMINQLFKKAKKIARI